LLAGDPQTSEAIVRHAYRQVAARDPSPTELQLGSEFLRADEGSSIDAQRVQEYAQALLGCSESMFVD
jgi:hypothetical protein